VLVRECGADEEVDAGDDDEEECNITDEDTLVDFEYNCLV
jgi:hypothetical protein